MYPAEIVMPMKAELTDNGFDEMLTPDEVDGILKTEGIETPRYIYFPVKVAKISFFPSSVSER